MSCARPSHLSRQVGFVFPFTSPSFYFTSSAFTSFIEECHLSFFFCEVIHEAEAGRPEVGPVCAHSIRGVSTSAAFHRNCLVASVLESATWRSNSVFVSFYLRDIQHEIDGIRSLGPFVAACSRIG